MRIRKHYGRLTPAERQTFVQALLALKDDGRYDDHVRIYQRATCWARRGSAFLPWHRHLLLRFEEDLRSVEPDVALPYWDFVHEPSTQASLWNEDFMGGDGRPHDGMVITGPFATEAGAWPLMNGGFLLRRLGQDPATSTLPTIEDLQHALDDATYDEAPWDASSAAGFRNRVEGWVRGPTLHNRVHAWVGGVMAREDAPDDPLFWLVHTYIDRLWSDWQRRHPGAEYQPRGEGPRGHNLDDTLWPWNGGDAPEVVAPFGESPVEIRPRDLIDHRVLGYLYDTDPQVGGGRLSTLAVGEEQPTFGFGEDVPGPPPEQAAGAAPQDPPMTTMAIGEEEPTDRVAGSNPYRRANQSQPVTTLAVGEEGPQLTTMAVGEESPQMTTLAIGEEGPQATTMAVGEEGPQLTTMAIGEEGPQPSTAAIGEEGPQMTTLAVGEEQSPGTTGAVGEEGPRLTTLAVGEEASPPSTQVMGEEEGSGPGGGGEGGPFGRY